MVFGLLAAAASIALQPETIRGAAGVVKTGSDIVGYLAGSISCQWWGKLGWNSVIDLPVHGGQNALPLFTAASDVTIHNLKMYVQVLGMPVEQPEENIVYGDRKIFNGEHKRSVVSFALVVRRKHHELGALSMETLADVYLQNPDERYPDECAPIYSDQDNVLYAYNMLLTGHTDRKEVQDGFVNGQFPGPLKLQHGDQLFLVALGAESQKQWRLARRDVEYGHITGTLTFAQTVQDVRIPESLLDGENIA